MSVDLSLPGLVDLRQPVLGDSFGWAGIEPTAAKKSVVFHHSGSDSAAEDGFSIANYHVNSNEWGGIGYHFVITRSDYPGRPPFTSPGAQIQYVGDLNTWRAHVANQNPGRVGVCFVGMAPDQEQLKLGRQLMEYLIAPNNILPSISFMNQATVHRLVPEQSTACPGDEYTTWLPYLQGSAWPYAVAAPETPEQGKGGESLPEGVTDWREQPEKRPVKRTGAMAINVLTGAKVADIPVGMVVDVAGYFDFGGHAYARTVFSATHGLWNGVDASVFDEPTGQPAAASVPVTQVETSQVTPNPVVIPDPSRPVAQIPTFKQVLVEELSKLLAHMFSKFLKKGTQ